LGRVQIENRRDRLSGVIRVVVQSDEHLPEGQLTG
jgi:hypothetical protein